jgi:SSS family solute:Na+ symporter
METLNVSTFFIYFTLYLLVMFAIGYVASRKKNFGGTDFLLAGRSLPLYLVLGTALATMVGTGSSMGAVGKGYTAGWAGALVGVGGAISLLFLSRTFAENRKYEFMTMTEEIAFYYENNKVVRAFASILLYLASIGWLGTHIIGGSYYLNLVTGLDLGLCKAITAAGFGAYVLVGGYLAVVWTDFVQIIIVISGFILVAVLGLQAAGGFENIMNTVPKEKLSFLGIGELGILPALSIIVAQFTGVMGVPSYRQRIYSADSVETAKKAYLITAFAYLLFACLPVIIGLSAFVLNPNLEKPDLAFPYMILNVLPAGLGIFVLIAGLSATMSSGDSDTMTGVSILMRDVWTVVTGKPPKKELVLSYSRYATIFTLFMAYILSTISSDIIGYMTNMIGTFMSGLAASVILGKLWKRATWQGAIAAYIGGSVTSLIILALPNVLSFFGSNVIPSFAMALLAEIIVSLLTPVKTRSDEDVLKDLSAERNIIEN